ncbi:hypothetical protein R69927_07344 [Paraburkholderia domus]|jgi:hypothetical protein|uniref:hypothetical protein n=1 Tax=Paraburkholderia domus TaxID=2793075 RepID=UPI0019127E97|nr:hypothetical protein [Paraburkholderia domus]MBK5054601.1 hypothetical protein [Burkholderia sp. R-70006]MBK5066081.1 hypothetical protein [Burkholderia sp. R-70199]MBK5091757.1 hypothetical protein [Burkholderia sp. R-69927]MBK5186481.1 hypothetical protein [Burkholderia sp. R-69749]MCI0152329.1 hypothetical protein [Paraburkholderia sediminicola]
MEQKSKAGSRAGSEIGAATPRTAPGTSDGLVLTPGGWRPRSKVHLLKKGQHISGKGGRLRVLDGPNGEEIVDYGPVSNAHRIKNRLLNLQSRTARVPASLDEGWIAHTGWTNTTGQPIASFAASWRVPQDPELEQGQQIYLFTGLQHGPDGSYILQPVLQWGQSFAGGGNQWEIGAWYVGPDLQHTFYSPLAPVNSNDLLTTVIALKSQSAGAFSYVCTINGAESMNADDVDELTWACVTLEGYGPGANTPMPSCSAYPSSNTTFSNIEIKVGESINNCQDAPVQWDPVCPFNNCNQSVGNIVNGSPGGSIEFNY